MEKTNIPWISFRDWREAKQTIRTIIEKYRQRLDSAIQLAADIQLGLTDSFPLLDDLSLRFCTECKSPCCQRATVWFDHADLIFIHLNQLQSPPSQIQKKTDVGCSYLEVNGCGLQRQMRPWICTRYLCACQMEYLRVHLNFENTLLQQKLNQVRFQRKTMEDSYIQTIV